jgi:hypothetical protein
MFLNVVPALVHQKEIIFGFMTPREHLLFQARARMSKEFKYDDIVKRVNEVRRHEKLHNPNTHIPAAFSHSGVCTT